MNNSKTQPINRKHKNWNMEENFPGTKIPFLVLPSQSSIKNKF